MNLDDRTSGSSDPNNPGTLHRRENKGGVAPCAWCHNYHFSRAEPAFEGAPPIGGILSSYQFGWQHAGRTEVKWDPHWFCSVDHYRRFHGGERPTGA